MSNEKENAQLAPYRRLTLEEKRRARKFLAEMFRYAGFEEKSITIMCYKLIPEDEG